MPDTQQIDPELWVEQYGDVLYRYAMLRLRNAEVAEEVVQETFLAALKGRGSYSGRSTERTWLVGILKHKIIDHFRKKVRERPASQLVDGEDEEAALFDDHGEWRSVPRAWDTDPQATFEAKEFWETFRECLAGLREREADAFFLRETEQLGTEEICEVLDVSPANLAVILHRTRKKLRRCLDMNWFGRTQEKEE